MLEIVLDPPVFARRRVPEGVEGVEGGEVSGEETSEGDEEV